MKFVKVILKILLPILLVAITMSFILENMVTKTMTEEIMAKKISGYFLDTIIYDFDVEILGKIEDKIRTSKYTEKITSKYVDILILNLVYNKNQKLDIIDEINLILEKELKNEISEEKKEEIENRLKGKSIQLEERLEDSLPKGFSHYNFTVFLKIYNTIISFTFRIVVFLGMVVNIILLLILERDEALKSVQIGILITGIISLVGAILIRIFSNFIGQYFLGGWIHNINMVMLIIFMIIEIIISIVIYWIRKNVDMKNSEERKLTSCNLEKKRYRGNRKMEIYDLMYSKCALDIYIYFFSDVELNKEKERKIKDIIYIIYMYSSYYSKDKSMQKFFEIFRKINDITDMHYLLSKDVNLSQFYQFFKMPKDILEENMKNEYQLCLRELKELILKTDIEDIMYFMKIKNKVDEIYEKIYNDDTSQEELGILENVLKKQLEYLENYLSINDKEAYEAYFDVKNGKNMNPVVNLGIELFELKKGDVKFSELKQLKDLKIRTRSANSSRINNLDNIEIDKEEKKQIDAYAIKKILRDMVLFIIFYFIIGKLGVAGYNNFTETKNSIMLIPMSIYFTIVVFYFVDMCQYIFVIFNVKNNDRIKGRIGFIGDITWGKSNPYYNLYFPQYDERYTIHTGFSTKKLKRKAAVKLIKIATKKMIVPISQK